jgi:phosphoribosylamine--glycine ligase/phosphoribosylaminoimidazole synthetase
MTTVLVVGSGGREHAMAWSVARSPRCTRLLVTPGNAGTPGERFPVAATDVAGVVALCQAEGVGLVLVGPDAALEAGLVDALTTAGIVAFGPTRAAAEIEWSKSFSAAFCHRHRIASPLAATFTSVDDAMVWVAARGGRVVVKADGLAAGKGVVLPSTLDEARSAIVHALADGSPVVLQERLVGEEISLFGITDGITVVALPPAQDHKRIGDGDTGPNTGGMGAYAPAPACPPELAEQLRLSVLQRAVDGLRAEGRPYVGVLFAGLMLTADGPRVIEFNARFGDPEAQVLLPLLRTDLVELALACCAQRLGEVPLVVDPRSAVSVVMAGEGYPASGQTGSIITGLDTPLRDPALPDVADDVLVFHAGTEQHGANVVTSGGRVLAVTAMADDVRGARRLAYDRVAQIAFAGRQFRRDIAWRALARTTGGYAASGVDIEAGNDVVSRMKESVARTYTPSVVAGLGSFGGVLDLAELKRYDEPVLVASTDGVGTKVMVGVASGNVAGLGADLVNHCINDILVQNARPLAFLDYIASSKLIPAQVAGVVTSMAEACEAAGCVLLGGETAEMPGVYHDGHLDVAGTIIGLADRAALLPRPDVQAGDVLVGLASSGPHTNGYSLLRKVFEGMPYDVMPDGLDVSLGDALLAVHRNYLPVLAPILDGRPGLVKALAHITGGGLIENTPRILPAETGAVVRLGSWPVPRLFALVREASGLDAEELHTTLNMGIGMVIVVAAERVAELQAALTESSWVIGEVVPLASLGASNGARVVLR